jgi:hypothetical protein
LIKLKSLACRLKNRGKQARLYYITLIELLSYADAYTVQLKAAVTVEVGGIALSHGGNT